MVRKAEVMSAMVAGIEAVPVQVEVGVMPGLPGMTVVGMPDADALEGRERVRCAIKSCGFSFPREKVVVSLAPSGVRHAGSGFDLAIALGVLAATGQVDPRLATGVIAVGELGLSGEVRPAFRGIACVADLAARTGQAVCCSPCLPARGPVLSGAGFRCLRSLADLRELRGEFRAPVFAAAPPAPCAAGPLIDAVSQAVAERRSTLFLTASADVAAAVRRALSENAPGPDVARTLEKAYSAAGLEFDGEPPMRAPHFSSTILGLVGGGRPVLPGEATLAHGGVLFLDDVANFSPNALDALRIARRDKAVRVVRAEGATEMPADFTAIGVAAPCPCGMFGRPGGACTCSAEAVAVYQERLSAAGNGLFEEVVFL